MITRGTTPLLRFTLPIDTDTIQDAIITIQQNGTNRIERQLSVEEGKETFHVDKSVYEVKLEQEDTLSLKYNTKAEVQLLVKLKDGNVIASQIFEVDVAKILHEGGI